jgi:hypothetical protein
VTGLEFAAALVGHLVWPAVAVAALLILRKPLAVRLKNLRAVKAGSFGAEFGETEPLVEQALEAEALEETKRTELAPADALDARGDDLDGLIDGFKEIAQRASENPSYAVVASWTQLERAMFTAVAELQPTELGARVNSGRAAQVLLQQRFFSHGTYEAIGALRNLRNEVAHGLSAPEAGAALGYVRAVSEITQLMYRGLAVRRRLQRIGAAGRAGHDPVEDADGTQ